MNAPRVSRRHFLRSTLAATAAAAVVRPGGAAARDPNTLIFTAWGGTSQDFQRQAFLAPFEKETGIKCLETTLGQTLPRLKTMVDAKNVEFDVGDGQTFVRISMGALGYLEPIDYATIGEKLKSQLLPQGIHKYGVGSYVFSECLAYRTDVFPGGKHPKTWAEVWDTQKFPGRRSLNGGGRGIRPNLEFALIADGVPIDKLYPMDEERAWKSLGRIKPHVVKWWTDSGLPAQLLVSKEVVLATTFNGRIDTIKKEGHPTDVEFNQGQTRIGEFIVPRGAPHRENAMRFIAFALRPDRQAEFAKLMAYGPTNREAFKLISAERARELPSSPENIKKQFFTDDEWWAANLPRVIERWNSWIVS